MKIPWAVWRSDRDYAGTALGDTPDSQLPISEMWVKTNDGPEWQGTWDRGPRAVTGYNAAEIVFDHYRSLGIVPRPWGVVRLLDGAGQSTAADEGYMAGHLAALAGGSYIVDLEPAERSPSGAVNYFRNDLGAGSREIAEYAHAFEAAGGRELWLWVDARPGRLSPCAPTAWREEAVVRRWYAQSYWTTFDAAPLDVVATALSAIARVGVPRARTGVTVPGDARPQGFRAVAMAVAGLLPPPLYRRGNATQELADAIAAYDGGAPVTEELAPFTDEDLTRLYQWRLAQEYKAAHPGTSVAGPGGVIVEDLGHDARGWRRWTAHLVRPAS